MKFDAQDLEKALELLVFGWGGVFLVLLLLYVVSQALLKFFPPEN
jgi:Na+-transporting methylmalonyl-CoA/oxaloacetate decarboxylase gamma subunit